MDDDSTKFYYRNHTKEVLGRLVKCVNACDGIDDVSLDILATKGEDGKTLLRHIIDKVDLHLIHDKTN